MCMYSKTIVAELRQTTAYTLPLLTAINMTTLNHLKNDFHEATQDAEISEDRGLSIRL